MSSPEPAIISVLKVSCLRYKNDLLETRKDCLVHFVSEDCEFTLEISKKLEQAGIVNFEALLSTTPQKDHAVVFEENNSYVFHLVVKSTYDERPHLEILRDCLIGLKEAMLILL